MEVIGIVRPTDLDVSDLLEENSTSNVSVGNIGPADLGSANIRKWLKVLIEGVVYYIPLWN